MPPPPASFCFLRLAPATRRTLPPLISRTTLRTLTTSPRLLAEGDVGATRAGGTAHGDAFTKREKAAEDMWIRDREKNVIAVLRDKIARQEAMLEEDRKALARMEDQYGRAVEGGVRS